MKKKQKFLGTTTLNKNRRSKISKSKIEWTILALLVLLIPIAIWSNLFAYEYYYFKCGDKPLELAGKYYRIPGDKGYGIHPGSDYSICSYAPPSGAQRDPSTKAGAAQVDKANRLKRLTAEHKIYVPNGYQISDIKTSERSDGMGTEYDITTNTGRKFRVSEMKKDSIMSYTNLCSKPAEENWSGTIIGKDNRGREICRTNISKYVKDYVVGINIGETAIMLKTPNNSPELLDTEVIAIFSAMELYSD